MARNTSQGAGVRQGEPKSPAPAPSPPSASEDRFAVLEEALSDVRQSLGVLRREVASIQREYVKVRELDELHRTVESLRRRIGGRDSEAVGTPSHEEKQPIPVYYSKRKDLSAFLTLFFNWAVSQNVEAALKSEVSVVMTTQKSRNELYEEYGRDLVKSLTAWNALNKALERDSSLSNTVIRAKSPSDAWMFLKSMVEIDDSDTARESAKKEFNNLKMST